MKSTVRNLRIVTAIGLAGAVLWAIFPYATNYVSSQAVVNAPLNTVLSPMQGHITQRSPPAGTVVASGTPLVAVDIEERDRRYREQLRARLTQLDDNLASIDTETSKLATLEKMMSARIRNYSERVLARLTAEAHEAQATLAAAEARRENAAATLRRAKILVHQGNATEMRIDADIAAHAEAVAEVSQMRARLERVRIEAAAAEAGIFVQNGWNDVPYSQQRLDGIVLKLASLVTERRRVASERNALDGQITVEEQLIAKRETFNPVAPSAGVVWRESGAVGETVVPGDVLVQLVNCEARFVEVTLAERHFGSIQPGDTAWVRLKGGGEAVTAHVTAVLGAGAKFNHPRLAASVVEAKPDQLRVLVSLRDAGIGGGAGAFCHVGRTAEVRFERHDLGILRGAAQTVRAQLRALFTETGLAAVRVAPAQAQNPGR